MNVHPIPPSTQGALCWLTAGKTRVTVLAAAFTALGFAHLLPKREKRAIALRAAIGEYLRRCYPKMRLRPFPLDRRVLGFDVRQIVNGSEKNDMPYLLTVKADERHAWVTHDGLPGDPAHSQMVSDLYLEKLNYYCPTTTGALIKRVVEEELHGVSVRGNGGLWFLPGAFIHEYRALAAAIERSDANPDSECVFSIGTFYLSDNPEVARDAIAALVEEAKALQAEIAADLAGVGDEEGNGMTGPGIASRRERLASMKARVQGYAAMFGVGLGEIEQLLAATDSALALEELADISA
jgi:hypothetical protein